MPSARAPSMSSAGESPTIAAAPGSTSSSRSIASKMLRCGFTRPWAPDEIAASTSSPWCETKAGRSRAVFETSPSFSPWRRSSASTGWTSS